MALAVVPGFAGFEAHVVNVTAEIEDALWVHPAERTYGAVFPQEYFLTSFFLSFSESFSEADQKRVGTVEYAIKQKPKPREEKIGELGGLLAARDWCHENAPADASDKDDAYYVNCFPNLCPYLSKQPDGIPAPGNDVGLPAFHDPETDFATGKIVKFNQFGNTINNDPADSWTVDLAVPCFEGQCAQDWTEFVHAHNPDADPDKFMAPEGLSGEVFGCDLWIEVTDIY